jgi:hypothetical protein
MFKYLKQTQNWRIKRKKEGFMEGSNSRQKGIQKGLPFLASSKTKAPPTVLSEHLLWYISGYKPPSCGDCFLNLTYINQIKFCDWKFPIKSNLFWKQILSVLFGSIGFHSVYLDHTIWAQLKSFKIILIVICFICDCNLHVWMWMMEGAQNSVLSFLLPIRHLAPGNGSKHHKLVGQYVELV